MAATLSAGALIAAVLVLIPLPSHWRARNVAILSLIAWLFVVDLIYGVNTIVWAGNVEVRIVVWCDIATKIVVGASAALPAAAMCICKHLELVSSGRAVHLTYEDKRRRMFFELAMCFGVPFLIMALHYIVQGHRFDIIEDIGCQAATYYSLPAVFIIWFPPLLFATITFVYGGLALHHFFRQRLSFTTHIHSCDSALTTRRYLLLIGMSLTEMLWGTILTAVAMYDNIAPGLFPYVSWAYVHAGFSRIGQFATVEFTDRALQQIYLFVWAIPASSFIFFVFFGFGEEAVRDYKRVGSWVARRLGIPVKQDKFASYSLPVSRPSLSTAKFSSFSPSSEFSDDKTMVLPAYLPRSHALDKHAPPSPPPFPASPARSEARTHATNRTSGLSDVELDDLLARCPSISTGVPSPNSPLEFGYRVEVMHPAEDGHEHPALACVQASIRAPSPTYSSRPISTPSRYSRNSSVVATCAGSVPMTTLSCGYEQYTV